MNGEPGWIVTHRTLPGTGYCTCPRWQTCDRPGKHPVHALFPHGSKDRVSLAAAREALLSLDPGLGRLSAALVKEAGERVLDADSPAGMAALWRAWEEVEVGWLHVRTPRGLHVWQVGIGLDPRSIADVNRSRQMVGGDVKASGFVVWPDGLERWVVSRDVVRDMVSQRGTVPPGTELVYSRPRVATEPSVGAGGYSDPGGAFGGLLRFVEGSGSGDRNNRLNWAAWRARALVAHHDWPEEQVASELYRAGRRAGLEHGETVRTVRSGLGMNGSWSA